MTKRCANVNARKLRIVSWCSTSISRGAGIRVTLNVSDGTR
jgi:hypothetical protein